MKATVHRLAVADPVPDAPVEAIVERLRDLLTRAEAGEVRGLAACVLLVDGAIEYGHEHDGGDAAWARLLAGAACLQSQIVDAR